MLVFTSSGMRNGSCRQRFPWALSGVRALEMLVSCVESGTTLFARKKPDSHLVSIHPTLFTLRTPFLLWPGRCLRCLFTRTAKNIDCGRLALKRTTYFAIKLLYGVVYKQWKLNIYIYIYMYTPRGRPCYESENMLQSVQKVGAMSLLVDCCTAARLAISVQKGT